LSFGWRVRELPDFSLLWGILGSMLGVGLYNAARADAVEDSFSSLLEIRRLACLGSVFLTDPEKGRGDVSHHSHDGVRMPIRTCVNTWDTARSRTGVTEDERSCNGKNLQQGPKFISRYR